MAGRTKLGEQYIRFSIDGLDKAEKDAAKTAARTTSTWFGLAKQAAKAGGGIRAAFTDAGAWVRKTLGSLGGNMIALGAPAAGIYAIAQASIAGTREGQLLSTAWEYTSRVFGNILSPAIRVGTTMLVRFADAVNGLSSNSKGWIAGVALAGVALVAAGGAAMAFGSMFSGAMGLASASFGLVTAAVTVGLGVLDLGFAVFGATAAASWLAALGPAALVIVVIAAVVAAIAELALAFKMVALVQEEGMVHASKSWVGYAIQGVKLVTLAFTDFWNFMTRQISDHLKQMAALGKISEEAFGSTKASRAMIGMSEAFDRNFGQIDRAGVGKFFDNAENWAEKNVPSAKSLVAAMKEAWKFGKDLPGMLKGLFESGGEMQLHPTFDVKFEGLAASFDRLQEAFAKGTPQDNLAQIRDNGKITNEKLDKIFERLGNIGAVVGP